MFYNYGKKKETADLKILKEFKEKYELTWPELGKVLGRSSRAVEDWHKRKTLPLPYRMLLQIFIDQPEIYKKYKCK